MKRKPHQSALFLLLLVSLLFFGACSKSKDEQATESGLSFSGNVEKGPFLRGATLTVSELDKQLQPTGRSFTTKIQDDKGSFQLQGLPLENDFVQLSIENAYYFDEVTGKPSSSPISLHALARIEDKKVVNLNILGQLEEKRVRYLVKNKNMPFDEAKKLAISELYKAFFVKTMAQPQAEKISLMDNSPQSAVLLGISTALLVATNSDSKALAELTDQIGTDLEDDGRLQPELAVFIHSRIAKVNIPLTLNNLTERYRSLGISLNKIPLQEQFTVKMNGDIIESGYFESLSDFEAALRASKTGLIQLSEQNFLVDGLYTRTINETPSPLFLEFKQNNVSPHNVLNSSHYRKHNLEISRLNIIMSNAITTNVVGARAYAYKAYPYYAFLYNQMIDLWGDPVYVYLYYAQDDPNKPGLARRKAEEVRTALIANLRIAMTKLNNTDINLARSVLAKLLCAQGLYSEAKIVLDEIIQSGAYRLSELSKIHTAQNSESIFGWDFGTNSSILPDPYADWFSKGNYRHIIRYTEIVLLNSEVNYRLGNTTEALNQLNLVRKRNGKSVLIASGPTILEALAEEYQQDMKNEGVYFAALKRMGLAERKLSINKDRLLLPIPTQEFNDNPALTQNPGY